MKSQVAKGKISKETRMKISLGRRGIPSRGANIGTLKEYTCEFCRATFLNRFKKRYCSTGCIKKRWERDNKDKISKKAEEWRRNKGILPAGKSQYEEEVYLKIRNKLGNDIEIRRRDRSILRNPETGYPLELDFYLPDLHLAFEIDGETHRTNCYGEERLKKQQRYDQIKEKLCKEKGITLVRIPCGKDIGIFGDIAVLRFSDLKTFIKI